MDFATLAGALLNGDVRMVKCRNKQTGAVVDVLCAAVVVDGRIAIAPFATMIDGDAFAQFVPVVADTHDQHPTVQ